MSYQIGSGYLATDSIKTSTVNLELVPKNPSTNKPYILYRFSFFNYQPVKVKINNETICYLNAEQGFEITEIDKPIISFIVLDASVQYQYIAGYK